jgi:hypothetical protein
MARKTIYELRNYWGTSGNGVECSVADLAEGEGVWVLPGQRYNISSPSQFRRLV